MSNCFFYRKPVFFIKKEIEGMARRVINPPLGSIIPQGSCLEGSVEQNLALLRTFLIGEHLPCRFLVCPRALYCRHFGFPTDCSTRTMGLIRGWLSGLSPFFYSCWRDAQALYQNNQKGRRACIQGPVGNSSF